jgi:hypothetical protein
MYANYKPIGTSGQLQYNAAGVITGDTSTTDGAGNISATSITTSGNHTSSAGNFVATTGNFTATAGNFTATAGNFVATAGNFVCSGTGTLSLTNARIGTTPAMASSPGTITVSTNIVIGVNDKVFYNRATAGGTLGNLSMVVTTGGAGVASIQFNSTGNETSTINYMILTL